jgi:hypothetical protein
MDDLNRLPVSAQIWQKVNGATVNLNRADADGNHPKQLGTRFSAGTSEPLGVFEVTGFGDFVSVDADANPAGTFPAGGVGLVSITESPINWRLG